MILVTGARGMLGGYVSTQLEMDGFDYVSPARNEFDLKSSKSIAEYLKANQFDWIIHLAAETDVDLCERDKQHAYLVNTLATKQLANHAREHDIPMIFISTSAVFGGIVKVNYCELDLPSPVNYYGSSKWFAEQYVMALCPKHLIIRSSFMIGGGPSKDKKFIAKILPQLKENKPVSIVYDKLGSLTYAKEIALFITKSIKNNIYGLVHISSENSCSRFDVVTYIAKKINSTSKITKVGAEMFPLSAPRATSEALQSISPFYTMEKTWEVIIDEYLGEWL